MVNFAPGNVMAECKSVEMHHTSVEKAGPGDSVGFSVRNVNLRDLRRGYVAGNVKDDPPRQAESFTAKVIICKVMPHSLKNETHCL